LGLLLWWPDTHRHRLVLLCALLFAVPGRVGILLCFLVVGVPRTHCTCSVSGTMWLRYDPVGKYLVRVRIVSLVGFGVLRMGLRWCQDRCQAHEERSCQRSYEGRERREPSTISSPAPLTTIRLVLPQTRDKLTMTTRQPQFETYLTDPDRAEVTFKNADSQINGLSVFKTQSWGDIGQVMSPKCDSVRTVGWKPLDLLHQQPSDRSVEAIDT